ncbi:MAG: hypothetical protein VKS61_11685, partial [Candidatus Sericytochromatia bacterium]|nr:hypothetical protein [Candidatus Sericytochromatia bacterium]
PWDGQALTVELPREDGSTLRLRIWGEGMRLLRAGQADLTLTDDMGPRGHGNATLVFSEAARRARPGQPAYVHVPARVALTATKGGAGGLLQGRVTFQAEGQPRQTVPFQVRVDHQATPCG